MSSNDNRYATIEGEGGVNYRDIADTMSILGYEMNHSSARNHVLRVMHKFARAYAKGWDIKLGDADYEEIIRSPNFQSGVGALMRELQDRFSDSDLFGETT